MCRTAVTIGKISLVCPVATYFPDNDYTLYIILHIIPYVVLTVDTNIMLIVET